MSNAENFIIGKVESGRPNQFRVLMGLLLSATLSCGSSQGENEKAKEGSGPSKVEPSEKYDSGVESLKNNEAVDYFSVAQQLEPYLGQLDEDNNQRLQEVIDLLNSNLEGVEVKKFSSGKFGTTKAISHSSKNFRDKTFFIEIDERWKPENGMDILIFAHELLHVVIMKRAKNEGAERDWLRMHAPPALKNKGKGAIEVRQELIAWEFSLVLLNQMSEGMLDDFFDEISNALNEKEKKEIKIRFIEKIAQKIESEEGQNPEIDLWLELYLKYKSFQKEGLDCKWSYDFAFNVGGMYLERGFAVYQVEPGIETGSMPDKCIYPLEKGPYGQARLWELKLDK